MPLLPLGPRKVGSSPSAAAQAQTVTPAQAPSAALSPSEAFNGMADSPTICPYFGSGCQPPDMALAVSPTRVFQGVNTSFSLYTKEGGIIAGPVNAQNFFGVPNPSPANCDPAGPFLSDPRAFYDPNTGLVWASSLQIENALGLAPKCHYQSAVWIANLNPLNGVMHVYRVDTALGTTTNANDFDLLGFNATIIGMSVNLFNRAGTAFTGTEVQFLNKHDMELGLPAPRTTFTKLTAGGVLLDTVQPVETEVPAASDPGVLYLADSFNSPDPSGSNCVTSVCHGFTVFAYDATTMNLTQKTVTAPSLPYLEPAPADQPGCNACIESLDNRISATPVFSRDGGLDLISFAHETAVFNGAQVVPAAQWVQLHADLMSHAISGLSEYQGGTLALSGDQTASFPAVMPDAQNNLTMVFDAMGHARNPSILVASRSSDAPLGTLGPPSLLKQGLTTTSNSRWGDYEATSYDGFSTNHVWVAAQYSGANRDWATWIAQP